MRDATLNSTENTAISGKYQGERMMIEIDGDITSGISCCPCQELESKSLKTGSDVAGE